MTDQSDLILIGYTNGDQIMYAAEEETAEGSFYRDSENNCLMPVYILKAHENRIRTTSIGEITLDEVLEARNK